MSAAVPTTEQSVEILQTQVTSLQFELRELQRRYDTLVKVNERAAVRYKHDYKKWRDFKRVLENRHGPFMEKVFGAHGMKPSLGDAHRLMQMIGKRKRFEEGGDDSCGFVDGEDELPRDGDGPILFIGGTKLKDARSNSLPPQPTDLHVWDPPEQNTGSQSTPSTPASTRQRSPLRTKVTNGGDALPLDAKATQSTPAQTIKLEEPAEPFISAKVLKLSEPIPSASSKLREINDYNKYKGRGRYAQAIHSEGVTSRTTSHEDENQPERYDIVRNKQERKRLLGDDCECCRDYYAGVGPLPARLQQPLWRSPSPDLVARTSKPCTHITTAISGAPMHAGPSDPPFTDDEITRHKQSISRHRHHWYRPKTPPGYWEIGFPDTQEASDINRRANEMIKLRAEGLPRDVG